MLLQDVLEEIKENGLNKEEANKMIDDAICEGEGIVELLEILGGFYPGFR